MKMMNYLAKIHIALQKVVRKIYATHILILLIKINIATARAGNVIGGGDWSKNRIIPDYYRSLILKKLILRNPKSNDHGNMF